MGATNCKDIEHISRLTRGIPFLIPGVGAQGGDLAKSVRYGNDKGVALISVSRGIIAAGDKSQTTIRETALDYRNKIMDCINA